MGLDRSELAARCLVALLARDYPSADAARFAVNMADALLARLRPAAPVAGESPRPEWVRITGPKDADYVTVGKAYRVKEWDESSPLIENDRGEDWWCAATGDEIESSWPSWEPCAAPSPAATPAVAPRVVVEPYGKSEWRAWLHIGTQSWAFCDPRSSKDAAERLADQLRSALLSPGRATSSERAAAGLPVDESATKPVDREGLARAIREADFATDIIARWPWEGLNAMQREVYFKRADAAIAFMAKGGVA